MSRNTHFIDARLALLLDDLALGTALHLIRLDPHYLCRGEWKGQFLVFELVVVVGYFLYHLLDLFQFEPAHKAQGAPLERDDWGCLLMELLSSV